MSSSDEQPVTQQAPKDHEPEQPKPQPLDAIKGIAISFIDQKDQRYPTVGDWFFDDAGWLQIRVSKMEDPRYQLAVAFHEFVEAVTCTQAGITPAQVDEFDMGEGSDLDEPGQSIRAPYHKEHLLATAMERRLINHMGVNWDTYDKEVSDTGA